MSLVLNVWFWWCPRNRETRWEEILLIYLTDQHREPQVFPQVQGETARNNVWACSCCSEGSLWLLEQISSKDRPVWRRGLHVTQPHSFIALCTSLVWSWSLNGARAATEAPGAPPSKAPALSWKIYILYLTRGCCRPRDVLGIKNPFKAQTS